MFENDQLQTRRIKRRYDILQAWYTQEVTSAKAGRRSIMDDLNTVSWSFNLKEQEDLAKRVNKAELGLKWGWDIPLLFLKMMANWDYAKDNGNKFLLRESIHGFPIMNYALKEGPFKVSPEAVFGGEDYHVVIQGDDGNLIYFIPDQDGLTKGLFVENLL